MTNNWLFKNSGLPLAFITFSYFYFVFKCGPRYMAKRPAYELKTFIRYYNIVQIVTNAWNVYTVIKYGWSIEHLIYTRIESSAELKTYLPELVCVGWTTLGLKVIDLIETGIFVLRKKQNQISFLHLYHHVTTVWLSWIYAKYFTYELALPIIVLNCSVHVIMYSYYLLASFGPTVLKLLSSVKPYITIIQMVQFVIIIVYLLQAIAIGRPICRTIGIISMINIIINFSLFYNFYKKTYTKKQNK